MENKVKRCTIITNPRRDIHGEVAEKVKSKLDTLGVVSMITDIDEKSLCENSDVIIVIGGDGTLLHSSSLARMTQIPLLGINLGHLGYITELETSELSYLEKLVHGDYRIENRLMLKSFVVTDGKLSNPLFALNDIAVSSSRLLGMVQLELKANGGVVGCYKADGIILATPTGSTAYSLSAGGPVLDPTLDCICFNAVSPHSLYARPIIFSSESKFEIKPIKATKGEYYFIADGKYNLTIPDNGILHVEKADSGIRLIKLKKHSFYDTLNQKMSE